MGLQACQRRASAAETTPTRTPSGKRINRRLLPLSSRFFVFPFALDLLFFSAAASSSRVYRLYTGVLLPSLFPFRDLTSRTRGDLSMCVSSSLAEDEHRP